MTTRILVYGDSNSWGTLDGDDGLRFAGRWPVAMAHALNAKGHNAEIVEECLPGRTTDVGDSQMDPITPQTFDGSVPLKPILLSHQPLDHVLIMLGTNDLKVRFNRSAADIAAGLMKLAGIVRATPCGPGPWIAQRQDGPTPAPSVSILCPLVLGARADDPGWLRAAEWLGGRAKSQQLSSLLASECAREGVNFIDPNAVAQSSDLDPIHWAAQTHAPVGQYVAEQLAAKLG